MNSNGGMFRLQDKDFLLKPNAVIFSLLMCTTQWFYSYDFSVNIILCYIIIYQSIVKTLILLSILLADYESMCLRNYFETIDMTSQKKSNHLIGLFT